MALVANDMEFYERLLKIWTHPEFSEAIEKHPEHKERIEYFLRKYKVKIAKLEEKAARSQPVFHFPGK
ncbi:hypothetical protein L596_011965 [Steinernema carpocapsae]|uniref:Uncharacterized protein n=1 Tax=Steinernema carpocapsae TaxID=34508 RepID=A0A4U5NW01_STECR|nr:hypothetical protein L596_011965 [Steinernema carpocapsae]